MDAIGNQVFEGVDVYSEMDRAVGESPMVTGPVGDTALGETFEPSPADSDGESPVVACGDVRKGTGEYDVGIGLTDVEVDGTSEASETVTIGNTGVDIVAVAVGSEETDESIAIRVGESFSDLLQTDQ